MSRRPAGNASGLKATVLALLPGLIRQWLPNGELRGDVYFALNPRRQDRHLGSFQINIRTGRWRDHAIDVGGRDAVSLYAYLSTGGDYRAAFTALTSDPLVQAAMAAGAAAPPAKPAKAAKPAADKLALVRRLYANATGLTGMPAATYLQNRGLHRTDAWETLRASVQHYPGAGACPALLASIDAPDGSLVGLHRTFLTSVGDKLGVANPRLTLGQVRGGAIRLGKASDELIICEGLEDGLTLFQLLDRAVWVAGGAPFLPLMVIPEAVRILTIAADNDAAGERAARRAADVFGVGGREVRIMRPAPGFKDFNDQLRNIKSKDFDDE
ncbi:MAG TPA: toprim domain-containing protein [Novosphingobium sp.]|nr:toprim domain-containing protein [Novosphingobium sp.]